MIYIKIYGKGRDKIHVYTKTIGSGDSWRVQLPELWALAKATCRMVRDATTGLDKDEFLRMMGAAWDAVEERGTGNE